jgi:hypothetical protein
VVLIYYTRPTAATKWQQAYKDNSEENSTGGSTKEVLEVL